MECGLQGAVCIWNGWSGSQEPVCEGLHMTCGMCKIFFFFFFFQQIQRVAKEATAGHGVI